MKPHPRIRKVVKWGGAVVTLLLTVAWVWSYWWGRDWRHTSGEYTYFLLISRGDLVIGREATWWALFLDIRSSMVVELDMMLTGHRGTWVSWSHWGGAGFATRFWLPASISLLATSIAWRLDVLSRRRSSLNLCGRCNYDRAGLGPAAVCPECGSATS